MKKSTNDILRKKLNSENIKPSMFDRGDGYLEMEKNDNVKYPPNWVDPVKGWFAQNQ